MTLIVCCYTSTGIALSGDSRATGVQTQQVQQTGSGQQVTVQIPWVLSDSARKVFCIAERYALATWGEAFIGDLPIAHHVNEFALSLKNAVPPTTETFADTLLARFRALAPAANLGFVAAGYDSSAPYVYEVQIAQNTKKRWNVDQATGALQYGVFYGGDWDIVQRLLNAPNTTPAIGLLNLQDAVDLTRHLIRTTIDQMRFDPRFASVGGHIDTITLTPSRTRFLVRKELHAS